MTFRALYTLRLLRYESATHSAGRCKQHQIIYLFLPINEIKLFLILFRNNLLKCFYITITM